MKSLRYCFKFKFKLMWCLGSVGERLTHISTVADSNLTRPGLGILYPWKGYFNMRFTHLTRVDIKMSTCLGLCEVGV